MRAISGSYRGMTLTEVVIALGLVAFLLPLTLGVLRGTFSTARAARDDSRGAMIARTIFAELELCQTKGRSEWWAEVPPALNAGERAPVYLSFDDFGRFVNLSGEGEWSEGVAENEASYLVKISGEDFQTESGAACRKVTVIVTSPARAPVISRRRFEFHSLFDQ